MGEEDDMNAWTSAGPRRLAAACGACLAALSGCAVGPDYHPPQAQLPSSWVGPTTAPASQPVALADKDLARWWTVFQDPVLTSLAQRAIGANLDLRQAGSRIRQARAARGAAISRLGPAIDAGASYLRSQSPGAAGGPGGGGSPPPTNRFQAAFDAGWELDIFGGARRNVEAADADLQVAVENRRNVLVTLTAEVARSYVDLRAYQQRAQIARQNLQAQQHSVELTRKRFEGGFVSGLDVANADALVATTAAQIPLLEAAARQAMYGLSVLLGREPGALVPELSSVSAVPAVPPSVPTGIPSDLLRRRPDIRAAEASIRAATARIGVATADLFPKFSITGSLGFEAGNLDARLNRFSRFWAFGPSVSWRVFDTGSVLSGIEVQKALEEQAVVAYAQTVLTAVQEVENALVASAGEQEHRQALVQAVAANRKAVDLAMRLYAGGQTDFLNVLQAQRSLYASEDALAESSAAACTDLIALYKALGGGWQEGHPEPPARP